MGGGRFLFADVLNKLDAYRQCFLFLSPTVKIPNEFGDGRLFSGRDPLGGGEAHTV